MECIDDFSLHRYIEIQERVADTPVEILCASEAKIEFRHLPIGAIHIKRSCILGAYPLTWRRAARGGWMSKFSMYFDGVLVMTFVRPLNETIGEFITLQKHFLVSFAMCLKVIELMQEKPDNLCIERIDPAFLTSLIKRPELSENELPYIEATGLNRECILMKWQLWRFYNGKPAKFVNPGLDVFLSGLASHCMQSVLLYHQTVCTANHMDGWADVKIRTPDCSMPLENPYNHKDFFNTVVIYSKHTMLTVYSETNVNGSTTNWSQWQMDPQPYDRNNSTINTRHVGLFSFHGLARECGVKIHCMASLDNILLTKCAMLEKHVPTALDKSNGSPEPCSLDCRVDLLEMHDLLEIHNLTIADGEALMRDIREDALMHGNRYEFRREMHNLCISGTSALMREIITNELGNNRSCDNAITAVPSSDTHPAQSGVGQ